MPHQPTAFDKLPGMLFYRIAIRLECRRNECYADAAVLPGQM
jgi:hypothetical protein